MVTKLFSSLRKQFTWKKIVAFFGSLGIIASAVLTIGQLIDQEPQGNQKPIMLADDGNKNGGITQGDKASFGDSNKNTWNDERKIDIKTGDTVNQGNQSSYGHGNVNTWNNSSEAQDRDKNEAQDRDKIR